VDSTRHYTALEADRRVVQILAEFFDRVGVQGCIRWGDVWDGLGDEEQDVVFLLKMLPCLEQQERGISERLLGTVRAAHVVVSFPVRSLGGRNKGMRDYYTTSFERLLEGLPWEASMLDLGNEIFYVLSRA
jgi:16S rRNA (guanine(1405)-N(7))-methyltransferase